MTIPNGWQTAKPTAWGLSGDEGKEQFEIEFQTEHGSIKWWGSFGTDKSRAYSEKQMRKCGWQGDWSHLELASEPVSILIEEEQYNGKTRQQVKAVGGGGGVTKPLEPTKAKSFIERMKASSSGKPASGDAFPDDPPAPAPSGGGSFDDPNFDPPTAAGDDIPFLSQTDTTRRWLR